MAPADGGRLRRIGVVGVLLVPSGLMLGLALASGGFFPDSVSVAAVAVLAIFSARAMLSRTALVELSPGVLVVASALIAFTALTLVSGSWSGSWARAMFAYDLVLLYTLVFVLIGTVRRSTARARVLLFSLAAVSVGISIAAVATWLLPDLFPVARDIPRQRLAWPTSYWNVTGLIGALGLVWVFSLSCSSAERAVVRVARGHGRAMAGGDADLHRLAWRCSCRAAWLGRVHRDDTVVGNPGGCRDSWPRYRRFGEDIPRRQRAQRWRADGARAPRRASDNDPAHRRLARGGRAQVAVASARCKDRRRSRSVDTCSVSRSARRGRGDAGDCVPDPGWSESGSHRGA